MIPRTLLPLLVVLLMVFTSRTAKADCWDYWDIGAVNCTGPGGCRSQWERVTCTFGCVSGSCNSTGNSTECCGTRHDYAAGYPDGQGGCHGVNCGGASIRTHARSSHTAADHSAELLQGYSPALILLSADLSYKPPELMYVLNRCSHNYELIVQDGNVFARGGI
jgi:hypothetical protein